MRRHLVTILVRGFAAALRLALLTIGCVVLLEAPAQAEKRVALVLGNAAYAHTRNLPNAHHDALAVAEFLRGLGFAVSEGHDATFEQMRATIRGFADEAASADVVVVYYAGHGVEVAGENYLVPVDAKLAASDDLEYEAVKLNSMIEGLRASRKLSLLIVDACRNNPLADKMRLRSGARRSTSRGLARMEAKSDFMIAFAADAGTVALDGTGINSPYAEALIRHIGTPGLDIRLAFGAVRDTVLAATQGRQEPVIYGALGGQVVSLVPGNGPRAAPEAVAAPREGEARIAWDVAKDSCDVGEVRLFAQRYKDTYFADLATKRIAAIEAGSACARASGPDPALLRELQTELRRVGCFGGQATGTWGSRSAAALKAFGERKGLPVGDTETPNEDLLAILKASIGRVCPRACADNEQLVGTACVKRRDGEAPDPKPAAPNATVTTTSPPAVAPGDCNSVRSACSKLRTQCMRACHEKLATSTYGSCAGCTTSFTTCIAAASGGACR